MDYMVRNVHFLTFEQTRHPRPRTPPLPGSLHKEGYSEANSYVYEQLSVMRIAIYWYSLIKHVFRNNCA